MNAKRPKTIQPFPTDALQGNRKGWRGALEHVRHCTIITSAEVVEPPAVQGALRAGERVKFIPAEVLAVLAEIVPVPSKVPVCERA